MKPLPLRLTSDDEWIWDRYIRSGGSELGIRLTILSRESDRRDAELMLYAQQHSRLGYVIRNTDTRAANSLVWVRAPSADTFGTKGSWVL
jgi:hypothetical protein